MISNLEKYKKDFEKLVDKGQTLLFIMKYECFPENFNDALEDKEKKTIKSLPSFSDEYQCWYSEAMVLIKQLLPDRGGVARLVENGRNGVSS